MFDYEVWDALGISNRQNQKRTSPRLIVVKTLDVQNKERI
jgi:hypothetical protein